MMTTKPALPVATCSVEPHQALGLGFGKVNPGEAPSHPRPPRPGLGVFRRVFGRQPGGTSGRTNGTWCVCGS